MEPLHLIQVPTNRSKQDNYRDKIAVQNNMYNDGAKK